MYVPPAAFATKMTQTRGREAKHRSRSSTKSSEEEGKQILLLWIPLVVCRTSKFESFRLVETMPNLHYVLPDAAGYVAAFYFRPIDMQSFCKRGILHTFSVIFSLYLVIS